MSSSTFRRIRYKMLSGKDDQVDASTTTRDNTDGRALSAGTKIRQVFDWQRSVSLILLEIIWLTGRTDTMAHCSSMSEPSYYQLYRAPWANCRWPTSIQAKYSRRMYTLTSVSLSKCSTKGFLEQHRTSSETGRLKVSSLASASPTL